MSSSNGSLRIGDVSRASGVSQRSIRYYESLGLIEAGREPNGYRVYSGDASERAARIHMLFEMGLPRDVVVTAMACMGDAPSVAHEALADRLVGIRTMIEERIGRLTSTRSAIDEFLADRR